MPKIANISSFKVVNSRGTWTLRTQVTLDDGSIGVETIPEGASKGQNEAVYIPIEQALDNVNTKLNITLRGQNPFDQKRIDQIMIELDGTDYKSNLGGNSILSISLAVAKASAASKKIHLYEYLASLYGNPFVKKGKVKLPTPLFNVLNGGKHAHNGLSFQEFMIIPSQSVSFDKAYEVGVNVYQDLKQLLTDHGLDIDVGDEGGFAPNGLTPVKALDFLKEAASKTYTVGKEVFFGMDVASESFWENGMYNVKEENLNTDSNGLSDYYTKLINAYELIYLEDPFYEKDRDGWKNFNAKYSERLIVTADDLVVTNPKILKTAIADKLANGVIVKPNQVGTLTETFEFIKMARANAMFVIVSHRSGDTAEDTFISDLAVAVGAEFIKSGAPARGERVAKYNRLLEIFHHLN